MKEILIAFAITIGLSLTLNSSRANSQSIVLPVHNATQANNQQAGYNCLTREVWSPEKQAWCNKLKILQNLTYTLPNGSKVSLTNGTFGTVSSPLKATLSTQPEQVGFGDINADKAEDAVALLTATLGKSAKSTVYLVTVLDINHKPQPLLPIGWRSCSSQFCRDSRGTDCGDSGNSQSKSARPKSGASLSGSTIPCICQRYE